tara:strand:+ start:237 stop:686 length:450 start_codon:yes stop_codon:yes gene_type:complete
MAEYYFKAKCLAKGWHGYDSWVDTGVDCIVQTERGGTKRVQITTGSKAKQMPSGRAFYVAKPVEKIRKDVDIVAIFLEAFDGQGNPEPHWFFLPVAVYSDPRFWKHYDVTNTAFYINIDNLKPPMDAAHEAWMLFQRKDLNRIVKNFLE